MYLMVGGVSLWFLVVYSIQPSALLTQEWFREWSCSRLECGVHDSIDTRLKGPTVYFVSSEPHRQCGVSELAHVSKRRH